MFLKSLADRCLWTLKTGLFHWKPNILISINGSIKTRPIRLNNCHSIIIDTRQISYGAQADFIWRKHCLTFHAYFFRLGNVFFFFYEFNNFFRPSKEQQLSSTSIFLCQLHIHHHSIVTVRLVNFEWKGKSYQKKPF